MEALFIIPAMVSENVNERLVPFIAKLAERNIALQNYSLIRSAITIRYTKKDIYHEGEEIPEIFISTNLLENSGDNKTNEAVGGLKTSINTAKKIGGLLGLGDKEGGGIPSEISGDKSKELDISGGKVEVPKGITFFSQVSLEPTVLEIPLKIPVHRFLGKEGVAERLVRVGFKCIPYTIKTGGMQNILWLMKDSIKMSMIQRFFMKKWLGIKNRVLSHVPSTEESRFRKGGEIMKSSYKNLLLAPPTSYLSNPKKLSKLMDQHTYPWTTMVILSHADFSGESDLKDLLYGYSKLSKYIFGDIIVVNESKESIHFCSAKSMSCSKITFAYLKQVMNLSNIVDYSELSSFSKPFSKVSFKNVVNECCSPVIKKMNNILREVE